MKEIPTLLTEQFIGIVNKWNTINGQSIKIAENFFVTPAEIHFIDMVWKNANMNVTKLAKTLGVTKGSVSQMVASLTEKKMLYKAKDGVNKKEIFLVLTEKGQTSAIYHEKMHENINSKLNSIFTLFATHEIEQASKMMEKIEEYFDDFVRTKV